MASCSPSAARARGRRLPCALAHREEGASREEVEQRLTEAGFDPGPIAHLL